jgi:hypothetical protein
MESHNPVHGSSHQQLFPSPVPWARAMRRTKAGRWTCRFSPPDIPTGGELSEAWPWGIPRVLLMALGAKHKQKKPPSSLRWRKLMFWMFWMFWMYWVLICSDDS